MKEKNRYKIGLAHLESKEAMYVFHAIVEHTFISTPPAGVND